MNWKNEPLVHFLLIGAALFALGALLGGDRGAGAPQRIEVSAADIDWLRNAWERQWRRPPTEQELRGLVDNHVREEILYREAMEMGLDRDDTIIRRRLVQKVEFLTEDLIDQIQPSDEALRDHFEENLDDYREPERRTFTHVYFSVDRRGDATAADAESVREDLLAMSAPPERAPELGDRFMMQYDYPRRSQADVARHMGGAFAEALFEAEPGSWAGPIRSGYGYHLVRVSEVRGVVTPAFEDVRGEILEDLQRERREEANRGFYEGLLQRYEVVVDETALGGTATGLP